MKRNNLKRRLYRMISTIDIEQLKEDLATKIGLLKMKVNKDEVEEELIDIYQDMETNGASLMELHALHDDLMLALY